VWFSRVEMGFWLTAALVDIRLFELWLPRLARRQEWRTLGQAEKKVHGEEGLIFEMF
jgi:hypothetical protein